MREAGPRLPPRGPAPGPPRRWRRVAWRGAGALAVAVVVLLAALRLGWPLAGRYPAEIAEWLSAQAGRRVEVAEVRAGWEGWRPNLVLRGVALPDARPGPRRHALARIASLRLRLDPWATFRHREPRSDELRVRGAALVVFRGAGGALRVPGLGGRPGPAGVLAPPAWPLLEGARISVRESRLLVVESDRAGSALWFDEIDVLLRTRGGKRRIRFLGKRQGDPDATLDLAMEVEGDLAAEDWSGRAALRARGLDLGRLGRMAGIRDPGDIEGLATLDLSGFWRSGRLHSARARVDLREAAFAAGGRRVALHAVSARAAARREAGGWRVEVTDLKVHDGDAEWPASAASFRYRPRSAEGPARLLGRIGRLRIEHLLPLLPAGPGGGDDWPARLREIAPSGRIDGLHFALDPQAGWPSVVLRAPFHGLAARERPPLPAISGAAGVLELARGRGALGILAGRVEGSWPEILAARVAVPVLSGRLAWLRGEAGGGWLRVADLGFENPHLKGRLRGRVEWPEHDSEALLGLALDLERGDLAQLRDYLPEGVLRPRLAAWLREAIGGGRIEEGALRLRGKLDERPFDGPGEIFSARARVSGVRLRYARGWPGVEDLEARLRIEGRRTEIRITGGRVEGAEIAHATATATIAGAGGAPPLLEVAGEVRGRTEQATAFLRHSPLAPRFARILDTLDARGPSTLALRLELPLPAGSRRVSGRLEVHDNLVDLPGFVEGVRGMNGVFEFRGPAVSAEGIEARYLGRPILLHLSPVAEGRGARIAIEGDATPRDLAAHLRNTGLIREPVAEAPAWLSPVHGAARWRAVVEVRGAPGEEAAITALRIRSDLRGASIALPAPFTKTAPEAAELGLDLRFGAGGRRDLDLRYGDLLSAALAFGSGPAGRTLERGAIRFGDGVAELPEGAGLEVSGALSQLPLGAWYRVLSRSRRSDPGAAAEPRPSPLAPLRRVRLLAGAPSAFGIEFGATRIDARADPSSAWTISLDASELRGEIRIPAGAAPARLHFDRLIARPPPERPRVLEARPPRRAARSAPRHLPDPPAFDFRCAECRLGEHEFRDLEIRARTHPRGTRFPSIRWRGAGYEAEAQGEWRAVDGARRTSVEARLHSDDLGLLIETLGGAGGVAGAADLLLSASWPGSPLDFDVDRIEGTLHVEARDGRLTQVRRGAASRLFGLLMLASLPRRLFLDFRDLFQEGFAFDTLEGSFSIASGDARTRDLVIDGPTATIEIAGRTGLVAEDYDKIATIVPKLSGSLPFLPIWIGQKLFNTQVFDRAFAFRYAIRGPWSEPRIEPLPSGAQAAKGGIRP